MTAKYRSVDAAERTGLRHALSASTKGVRESGDLQDRPRGSGRLDHEAQLDRMTPGRAPPDPVPAVPPTADPRRSLGRVWRPNRGLHHPCPRADAARFRALTRGERDP